MNNSNQNNNNRNNQSGSKSIFNDEAFTNQFKGFSEQKTVKDDKVFASSAKFDSMLEAPKGDGYKGGEKPKGKSNTAWNIAGAIVIILLLVGIGYSITERREKAMSESGDLSQEQIEQLANVVFSDEDSSGTISTANGITAVELVDRSSAGGASIQSNGTSIISSVRLALLSEDKSIQGKTRGCDVVYFVDRAITPTRAPLNSAISQLFIGNIPTDTTPGNFISTQQSLSFVNAVLNNGVAQINLTGELGPYDNDCDQARSLIQIEETALQFPTVRTVEIYLDGERLGIN